MDKRRKKNHILRLQLELKNYSFFLYLNKNKYKRNVRKHQKNLCDSYS